MAEFEDNKYKVNLKDIKSSYNIKTIFSFLYEKHKLKMIVYNKELQKIFLIGIEDYKKKVESIKQVEKMEKGRIKDNYK